MDKAAKPDPIAAANSAVTAAEQTLNELIRQRDAVTAREGQLTAERSKIAYLAHSGENAKAKTRLSAIHRELAEMGSEIAGFDAAIEEAKLRLTAAKHKVAQEIEWHRCRETLDHLERLIGYAHGADAALRAYVDAITQLDRTAQQVCAVAGRPDAITVKGAINRSLSATLCPRLKRVFDHIAQLPPNERHDLAYWSAGWANSIRRALEQRIAAPEQLEVEVEAA